MKSQDMLQTRRAIAGLAIGESATLEFPEVDPHDIARVAKAFGRDKGMPIITKISGSKLIIERVQMWLKDTIYRDIDALEVGQSYLFEVPPEQYSNIRSAAAFRNRTGRVKLSCRVLGNGISVTRMPLTTSDAQACGAVELPRRATKYDLDRLATEKELRFEIERKDQHKLRLSVTHKARVTGWGIRCRLQDDGSMLVYRTDLPEGAA